MLNKEKDKELEEKIVELKEEEKEIKQEEKDKEKDKENVRVIRRDPDINFGLTSDEAEIRIQHGMSNTETKVISKTYKQIFSSNIFTFFNLLTFSIAGWLFSVKQFSEIMFLIIITSNIVIGIVQEIKAKRMVDKLSLISSPTISVVRDGDTFDLPVSNIVIDDIINLKPGKQISCDAVVREGIIEVDESLLTGESDAILKNQGDRILSGSYVVSGNCKAQVIAVGKNSYVQRLTSQAKKFVKPKSELFDSLKLLITVLGFFIVPMGILLFLTHRNLYTEGFGYVENVKKTSGAVIGMIPAGLFLLTMITLSLSVIRLGKSNTLVQEIFCIEILARVNILCLDKTGTITDGSMQVKSIVEYPNDLNLNVKVMIASMNAILNDQNFTSIALEEKFGKGKKIKHKNILSFSSERKFSAVEFDKEGTLILGAPEYVLQENYKLVEKDVEKYSSNGLRVLVLAHSNSKILKNQIAGDKKPLALILIEDNIRSDAKETIDNFKNQGVLVKVISGDNPLTVSKIAERAGIEDADKYVDLTGMTDKEVERIALRYNVFGRVSPQQKKILIQSMRKEKNTVAMVGDGVNDILALKEADCSIAMASGSDATRSISHIVLLDSNFNNMPKVVDEGRRVINNIQKVSILFLTKTVFSFLLVLLSIINKKPYPIAPKQLYLIDFFVIAIPSFLLALEPNLKRVEGKFLIKVLKAALPGALTISILSSIVYFLSDSLNLNIREMSTLIIITATYTSLIVLNNVSKPYNIYRKIIFILMFSLATIGVLFFSRTLELSPLFGSYMTDDGELVNHLQLPHILLLVALLLGSSKLINILNNFIPWIKKTIKEVTDIISKL